MTENKLYELLDLIEEIKKVDNMIQLHVDNVESSIMLSQYNAKKLKLTSNLISELIAPSEKSNQSMRVIISILEKFYKKPVKNINLIDQNSEKLERLMEVL